MSDLLSAVMALIGALKAGDVTASLTDLLVLAGKLIPLLLQLLQPVAVHSVSGDAPALSLTKQERSALVELRKVLDEEPVGSQLTVFWHTKIAPFLKSLLEAVLGKL